MSQLVCVRVSFSMTSFVLYCHWYSSLHWPTCSFLKKFPNIFIYAFFNQLKLSFKFDLLLYVYEHNFPSFFFCYSMFYLFFFTNFWFSFFYYFNKTCLYKISITSRLVDLKCSSINKLLIGFVAILVQPSPGYHLLAIKTAFLKYMDINEKEHLMKH